MCLVPHISKKPELPHSIEPLVVDSLTEDANDLKKFIEKKKIIETLIQSAKENLQTIDSFEASVEKARQNIEKALKESFLKCKEKARLARENIEKLINDLETRKFVKGDDEILNRCFNEDLALVSKDFKFILSQVKDDQVVQILDSFANLVVVKDPFKSIPTIYHINPKSHEIFFADSASLQFNKVPFPAGLHLKELGAWCEVSAGNLIYCGGSVQASCSKETYEIDLIKNCYKSLKPMNEERCLPAVIKKGKFVYVFGGYQGKISLKSAEKYDIVENSWTDIGEMAHPRSAFTASSTENQIFLVGDHRDIEFFDVSRGEFGILSLKLQVNFKYSTSFVCNKRVIVFQKDKLCEGGTDMTETKNSKNIPTGNWWSQFSPVLFEKKLIFGKYDDCSLWSFDLEKNEIKKVMKFGLT
jgi:HEPN domain-containing protein